MNGIGVAQPPVVVLGAGIAGLVAARQARRLGFAVRVFEAGPQVAGMAASHTDADGFSYDVGAHFITNRFAAALGMAGKCRVVRRYGEVVPVDGRFHRYPIGLLGVPRYVASAAAARLPRRGNSKPLNAADWFRRSYGRALAEEIALPLLEAWSGVPASELAPSVGDKIPTSAARTVFLRGAARVTRRAVAIGYCNAQPQSAAVFHVYPEGGVASLCEKLASDLDGAVSVSSPVDAIHVERERAIGVTVGGRFFDAHAVISTAPINRLPGLVRGSDALAAYEAFRFRPLLLVNLKLSGRNLLPDVVVWMPDANPFFRLTEAPMSMPWLAPDGATMVLAEIGAQIGDVHWRLSDDELIALCAKSLSRIVPDAETRLIGGRVLRSTIAYPVFDNSYEADRQRLGHPAGTGIAGLLSVGRNGEFDHILMEDIYWRTQARVRQLLSA